MLNNMDGKGLEVSQPLRFFVVADGKQEECKPPVLALKR